MSFWKPVSATKIKLEKYKLWYFGCSGDPWHHHAALHDGLPHGDWWEHAAHVREAPTHWSGHTIYTFSFITTFSIRSVLWGDHLLGDLRHGPVGGHLEPSPQGDEGEKVRDSYNYLPSWSNLLSLYVEKLVIEQIYLVFPLPQDPAPAEVPGVQGVGQDAPDQVGAE